MPSAYLDGLRMLGRRELSEAQIRQRLTRRGHDNDGIDAAVLRLKEERAIDDARVAEAIARTEVSVKRRGRARVRRQLENAGIAPTIARRAMEDTFSGIDEDAMIASALAKRLSGDSEIGDEKEFARLYRFLIGRGFERDRVVRALSARRRRRGGGARPNEIE